MLRAGLIGLSDINDGGPAATRSIAPATVKHRWRPAEGRNILILDTPSRPGQTRTRTEDLRVGPQRHEKPNSAHARIPRGTVGALADNGGVQRAESGAGRHKQARRACLQRIQTSRQ